MNNKYFFLRHGQAVSNVKEIASCWPEKTKFPLTKKGKTQIKAVAEKLKEKKINLIFSSDLLRTKQTAGIVSEKLEIEPKYDKRLREYDVGIFNDRPLSEFREFLGDKDRFKTASPKGENYTKITERMFDFFQEIERKYPGKTILIISHQVPLALLEAKIRGISNEEFYEKLSREKRLKPGELRKIT